MSNFLQYSTESYTEHHISLLHIILKSTCIIYLFAEGIDTTINFGLNVSVCRKISYTGKVCSSNSEEFSCEHTDGHEGFYG